MKTEEAAELRQLAGLAKKYPNELRHLAITLNQQNEPPALKLQDFNDIHP